MLANVLGQTEIPEASREETLASEEEQSRLKEQLEGGRRRRLEWKVKGDTGYTPL